MFDKTQPQLKKHHNNLIENAMDPEETRTLPQ